jgi:hypothetical protein
VGWESSIAILGKDRLGDVSFILLVETFSMLDSSKSPLINVELEILEDSRSLAPLPLREVEQSLAFA